jgi:hypothetical protein
LPPLPVREILLDDVRLLLPERAAEDQARPLCPGQHAPKWRETLRFETGPNSTASQRVAGLTERAIQVEG